MQLRHVRFTLFSRLFLLLPLLSGLLWPALAQAQEGQPAAAQAQLTGVNTSAFPEVDAFLRVNGADGTHTAGLAAAAFRLTENGAAVSGLRVAEEDIGVQVVFVLDSTDAFKARDANGVNRLEQLQEALTAYTQGGLRAGLDDVTVLTSEGPLVEHSDDPAAVAQALAGYTSTFAGVADPFTLLNTGLDYASDVPRQAGMARLLIFISNGFNRPDVSGQLADAATRAAAVQVPIYTLFVGPAGGEGTTSAVHLKTLAESTGAERLLFAGPASLDPFYAVLAKHTRQYRRSYRSTLSVTGQHTLGASVSLAGATLPAGEVVFPLRIEAPTVSLGSVPLSVVRVAAAAGDDPALAEPTVQAVPLTVDFPDGHPRGLTAAELLVDGAVVASAPATSTLAALNWPLAAYATSADHVLAVRLVDELGLAAASQPVTVTVSLQEPAAALAAPAAVPTQVLNRPGWPLLALALIGVLLAAGVGVLAWWLLTRSQRAHLAEVGADSTIPGAPAVPNAIRPPSARSTPRKVRRVAPAAPVGDAGADLAQAGSSPTLAATQPAAPRATGWARLTQRPHLPHVALPTFRWPTRPVAAPTVAAYLEVVEPGGGGAPQADIEVTGAALTLGRDAALADTVFHDRSVSRLHARLVHEDGLFRLYDAGSTSGTWINYTPIANGAGPELKHGDLINLGRVQLRFMRRDAPPAYGAAGPRVVVLAEATALAALAGNGHHAPYGHAPANAHTVPSRPAVPAAPNSAAPQAVEKTE